MEILTTILFKKGFTPMKRVVVVLAELAPFSRIKVRGLFRVAHQGGRYLELTSFGKIDLLQLESSRLLFHGFADVISASCLEWICKCLRLKSCPGGRGGTVFAAAETEPEL
jgi:hypothetical protein